MNRSALDARQIEALEGRLAGTLKPFAAPHEFVQRLRAHIHLPEGEALVMRLYDWERLVLVFAGVLSGTLAIITLGRALYHLVGRRNG